MYWILVVKDHRGRGKEFIPGIQILQNRVKYGFWVISSKNPLRRRVKAGDRGIFYVAGAGGGFFAGECTIKSEERAMDSHHRSLLEGYPSTLLDHYFEIEGHLWPSFKPLSEMIDKLSFITNKERWWAHLQGTLKQITAMDFEEIRRA